MMDVIIGWHVTARSAPGIPQRGLKTAVLLLSCPNTKNQPENVCEKVYLYQDV